MNKKVERTLAGMGFSLYGNSARGVVKGIDVCVTYKPGDNGYPLGILFSCYATAEQKQAIGAALNNRTDIKGEKRVIDMGVVIYPAVLLTVGGLAKRLPEMINWTAGMLALNGAVGGVCPKCGRPYDASAAECEISGFSVRLDADCVAAVNSDIDAHNAAYKNAPNNYFRGFLGAAIGGLAGCIVTFIFYLFGLVSWWSGLIAAVVGSWLYGKFGGKRNKMMILIVVLTSLVMLTLTVFIVYLMLAKAYWAAQGVYSISAFEAFSQLMDIEGMAGSFFYDLALVVVFTLVGTGAYAVTLWQKVKQEGKKNRVTVSTLSGAQQQPQQPPQSASDDVRPFDEYINNNSDVDPFDTKKKD